MNDRICKEVRYPAAKKLTEKDVYLYSPFKGFEVPNCDKIRDHFNNKGKLENSVIERICFEAANVLRNEPNCISVATPCKVIGDIHGQYYDMVHFFNKILDKDFPKFNLLFLGDYVDRGAHGLEVMIYVLALKINYP